MISKWSFFLGCFAMLMLLVITTKADARGRGGGKSISRSGPASSGSVRSHRAGHSQGQRHTKRHVSGNRQDHRQKVRSDRSDVRQDRYDDRRDFRKDRYDDRRDFREDVYDDRRRVRRSWRVGSTLTAATFRSLSCRTEIIVVGAVTYYRCGTGWYTRAYHGGSVTYVVVTTPAGY